MIRTWRDLKDVVRDKTPFQRWVIYRAHSMRVLAKHLPHESQTKQYWQGYNNALFEICVKIAKGPRRK